MGHFQSRLYRGAVRHEGQWNYTASTHKPMGPFHPFNKSALVAVTRGGTLRLVYQQPDSRWLEALTEIESIGSSIDVLTHASLCADKGIKHIEDATRVQAETIGQITRCSLWLILYPVNFDSIASMSNGTYHRIQSRFLQRSCQLSAHYRFGVLR